MENTGLHIGKSAPRFRSTSTLGDIKLSDYLGKWLVVFKNLEEFSPVATTELISLSKLSQEFEKRNCAILGVSNGNTNSNFSWINDIENLTNTSVTFPIINTTDEIEKNYNATNERYVILLDPNQTVRLILMYPKEVGINVYEILRCIDALQESDKTDTNIPANWVAGSPTMYKIPINYTNIRKTRGYSTLPWYLCFKNNII